MNNILDLRALMNLPQNADGEAVYFLWDEHWRLVYVGASTDVEARLRQHRSAKLIPHKFATRLSCQPESLLEIESQYICHYRPPANKKNNPEAKYQVGRPRLLEREICLRMRQCREEGMSVKQCAAHFGTSVATAMRVLSALRIELGPEKLPNSRSGRSHLYALRQAR